MLSSGMAAILDPNWDADRIRYELSILAEADAVIEAQYQERLLSVRTLADRRHVEDLRLFAREERSIWRDILEARLRELSAEPDGRPVKTSLTRC
jgi:hypothetical protein